MTAALPEQLFATAFNGEPPGIVKWRQNVVGEFPHEFRSALMRNHMHIARRADYATANRTLHDLQRQHAMPGTGITASTHREAVKEWADKFTKRLQRDFNWQAKVHGSRVALKHLEESVTEKGEEWPGEPLAVLIGWAKSDNPDIADKGKTQIAGALLRLFDPRWWVRKMTRRQGRIMEQTARVLRMVRANTGQPYASDYSVRLRREQKARNRAILEELEAYNPGTEETVNLWEAVQKSVANPTNRRHELMTRMRGFEDVAQMVGHVGVFYTITTPSKYHPTSNKGRSRNPRYNGSTPTEAQQYLCKLWQQIRAKLHRNGVIVYGFRVAEPHHDGTPHWHMLLFMQQEHREFVTSTMRLYAMREDGTERGADEHRFTAVDIDTSRGSATGYIAKYISKNVDGQHITNDLQTALPGMETAERVNTWAGRWGIRQFQQVGGPSVTVWRELRRLDEDDLDDYVQQYDLWDSIPNNPDLMGLVDKTERGAKRVRRLWEAADSADWAAFVLHQGGPTVPRSEHYLKTWKQPAPVNDYGEELDTIKGVVPPRLKGIVTRATRWVIRAVCNERSEAQQGASAPPRSSVNNCTGPEPPDPDQVAGIAATFNLHEFIHQNREQAWITSS